MKKEVALHVPVNTYKTTSQFLLIKFFQNKSRKLYDTRNGHEKSRTLFKVRLQLVGDTWFESIIKGKTG